MTPPPTHTQRHLLPEWGSTKTDKMIVKDTENHKSTTSMPENDQTRSQAASQTALKVKQDEDLHLEVVGGGVALTLRTATVQIGIMGGH